MWKQMISEAHLHHYLCDLKQTHSAESVRAYSYRLRQFADFVKSRTEQRILDDDEMTPAGLARAHIAKLLTDNQLSNNTVNSIISAIVAYLRYCGYDLESAPRRPRNISPAVCLTREQEKMVVETLGRATARDRAIISLILHCGLSIKEISQLRVGDIHLRPTATRVSTERGTVFLNSYTATALEQWLFNRKSKVVNGSDVVFLTNVGEAIKPGTYRYLVRRIGWQINLELSATQLRNTYKERNDVRQNR